MAPNKNDNWVRRFAVTDPKKHHKGFTIYRVTSIVYPKVSPEAVTKVVVWKRYNDFKKLHTNIKDLCRKFDLKENIPKFAKAKIFKRFEEEVINERVKSALTLLDFIGNHFVLFTSDIFIKFFESGYQLDEPISQSNHIFSENGNSSESLHSSLLLEPTLDSDMLEKESPLLKLGGIWDYPQVPDIISLSSQSSSDDCTTFTSDTTETCSRINSPLQQTDLQYFDPLPAQPTKQQACNLWLLSTPSNNNLIDECIEPVMSHSLYDTKQSSNNSNMNMTRSMSFLPGNVGDTVTCYSEKPVKPSVTCHSEKPVKPSEMWLSVRTQDFSFMNKNNLLAPGLTDSEAWLTPPGTPAGTQDYLVEAAYHVGQAQTFEVSGEYEAAFSFYKAAIACLLSGVHDDEDRNRRKAVRDKTAQYLQRAEHIYSTYLASNDTKDKCVKQSVNELKLYKVLSIIDRVMLVMNTQENKCYVIKGLEKSPCPVDTKRKTIIPRNVPYMVQLIKHYESDCTVYLVLQYASGGKLWDHIDSYLQSVPPTPVKTQFDEKSPDSSDSIDIIFSARNVKIEEQKVDTSATDQKSYFDLIKSYTSSMFGYTNGSSKAEDVLVLEEQNEFGCKNIPESIMRSESHTIFDKENIVLSQNEESFEKISESDVLEQIEAKNEQNTDTVLETQKEQNSETMLESLEVNDLVASSQKLLESVSQTLIHSEEIMKHVNVDLSTNAVQKKTERIVPKDLNCPRKRSSSNLSRSRFDRRYSSDDILEPRTRTASSSLDRGAQWSRLVSMIEPPRRRLPEATIRVWAAELLVAIETLHRWGVICKDLNPDNILLGDQGHLLLTYQSYWQCIDPVLSKAAVTDYYAAPETSSVFPVTPSADWWSYGAMLYELLTGKSLVSCHPYGIHNHTILNIPEFVSDDGKSLLTLLLKFNPSERLGSGANGSDDVKAHPFFSTINWQVIYDTGVTV